MDVVEGHLCILLTAGNFIMLECIGSSLIDGAPGFVTMSAGSN